MIYFVHESIKNTEEEEKRATPEETHAKFNYVI